MHYKKFLDSSLDYVELRMTGAGGWDIKKNDASRLFRYFPSCRR